VWVCGQRNPFGGSRITTLLGSRGKTHAPGGEIFELDPEQLAQFVVGHDAIISPSLAASPGGRHLG
jgi:hypothetical protein